MRAYATPVAASLISAHPVTQEDVTIKDTIVGWIRYKTFFFSINVDYVFFRAHSLPTFTTAIPRPLTYLPVSRSGINENLPSSSSFRFSRR